MAQTKFGPDLDNTTGSQSRCQGNFLIILGKICGVIRLLFPPVTLSYYKTVVMTRLHFSLYISQLIRETSYANFTPPTFMNSHQKKVKKVD